MANIDHVEKLWEGVGDWNMWRKENPGIEPDLVDANLAGAAGGEAVTGAPWYTPRNDTRSGPRGQAASTH